MPGGSNGKSHGKKSSEKSHGKKSSGKSHGKKSKLKSSNKSVNLFIKALVQTKGGKVFPSKAINNV